MSNSLNPYKPDSLWKSIRNKQRRAYAQGLFDAYEVISNGKLSGEDIEKSFDTIIKQYEQLEKEYED